MPNKKEISAKNAFIQDFKKEVKTKERKRDAKGRFIKMFISADDIIELTEDIAETNPKQ